MYANDIKVISLGSALYGYSVPAVVHSAAPTWYNIDAVLGKANSNLWDFMDSVVVLNNSALSVHFYLGGAENDYYILPYGTQPVTRRAFRTFGFYNPDAVTDIAAGLITMSMRRLPPNFGVVTQS